MEAQQLQTIKQEKEKKKKGSSRLNIIAETGKTSMQNKKETH